MAVELTRHGVVYGQPQSGTRVQEGCMHGRDRTEELLRLCVQRTQLCAGLWLLLQFARPLVHLLSKTQLSSAYSECKMYMKTNRAEVHPLYPMVGDVHSEVTVQRCCCRRCTAFVRGVPRVRSSLQASSLPALEA